MILTILLKRLFRIFLVVFPVFSYSQTIESPIVSFQDSLQNKTYEELYNLYILNKNNNDISSVYINQFIKKARKLNDTLKIGAGFYFLTTLSIDNNYIKYNDSLIKYAKILDISNWLWGGYSQKGNFYTINRKYKRAIENQVKAYEYALKWGDEKYIDRTIVSLGLLKERIGKYDDALAYFTKSYTYTSTLIEGIPLDSLGYNKGVSHLSSSHLLSNSYRLNKKLDSADLINKDVQKFQKFDWAQEYLNKIRLNAAEVHYDRQQYEKAIDSATMAIPMFTQTNNTKSIAVCHYIQGMSFTKLGDTQKGVDYLQKMDSIYSILGNIYPPVRPGYEYLQTYYKKTKDIKKQLYYAKQLLRFDSIAHANYAFISKEFVEKIEKPELIQQQHQLQNQLQDSENKSRLWIVFICIAVIALVAEIYRRRKIISKKNKEQEELHSYYQQKFDALLAQNGTITTENTIQEAKISTRTTTTTVVEEEEVLGIAEEVVDSVLAGLKSLEQKHFYTNSKINATLLAKRLDTNANYLGRIIKYHYQKSFRNYINDLRITYALGKLRNDSAFKNYTVTAMAREVGFKNAEPFSKSFKNRTNFYPSEFVEKLKS